MNKTVLIFGAGKTGRGFAAHLAFLGGYDIVLIDKNEQLVQQLKETGQYDIQILGNEKMNCTVRPCGVYQIDDTSWHSSFTSTELIFTSVFGNNLEELAKYLAIGLKERIKKNPTQNLNIITCENYTNAASFLKENIIGNLRNAQQEAWLSENVGFSESMILRTCLNASKDQHLLTIRAQNFFDLPCDGENFKGNTPELYGIKPLENFGNQLRRKIYTYNCINAVITFMGATKGYTQLFEAGNDPGIIAVARKAAWESSEAQIAEFGFDSNEQKEWVESAFTKFADTNLPDPIDRNGADPARKLSREDRLIGPALLALKHGIRPDGLLAGIFAGFEFLDTNKNLRISDLIANEGIDKILEEVCQLNPNEQLFTLIKQTYLKITP